MERDDRKDCVPLVPKEDASGLIFSWLKTNFEEKDHDAVLPRKRAFELYVAHCAAMRYEPTTKAAFGKLLKKAFPNVGTKRLTWNGGKKQRFYSGMAYRPRRLSRNQTSGTAPYITWIEEKGQDIVASIAAQKRKREHTSSDRDEVGTLAPPAEDVKVKVEEEGEEEEKEEEKEELEEVVQRSRTSVAPRSPGRANNNLFGVVTPTKQGRVRPRQAVMPIPTAGAHLEVMRELDYYSRLYIKELWGINPINPATTDIFLLSTGVRSERSNTLALTSCLLMSSASFLVGHWHVAREYFHKARFHLESLFDMSDYDIACVLLPLSWWTRLYSDEYSQGLSKQHYYVTLGRQICENINAFNDETYWNLASMHSVLSKEDPSAVVEAAKRKEPYRRNWEPVRGLTYSKPDKATSLEVHLLISRLYGVVYPICTFYQENGWNHEGWKERKELLRENLGLANELEEKLADLIEGDQSCTLLYTMMRCEVCAVRAFIFWALRSDQQLYAAQLLQVAAPIMVMTTHEFTTNDYLLMRLPVDILVATGQTRLLKLLYEALLVHSQFYWLRRMCCYIGQRLTRSEPKEALSFLPWEGHAVQEREEAFLSPLLTDLVPLTSPLSSPPPSGMIEAQHARWESFS